MPFRLDFQDSCLQYASPAVPSAAKIYLWPVPECRGTGALTLERTTQGGPPSGDRKCGTGKDLALVEGKDSLGSMDAERTLGGERRARLLGGAGEPCGRVRAGSPPAEERYTGGRLI